MDCFADLYALYAAECRRLQVRPMSPENVQALLAGLPAHDLEGALNEMLSRPMQ